MAAMACLVACSPAYAPAPPTAVPGSASTVPNPAASVGVVAAIQAPASTSAFTPPPTSSAPEPSNAPAAAQARGDAGASVAADASVVGEALALRARLLVVDTVVGNGREAKEGDAVSVHCIGTLADGKVFESSRARKRPLHFVVGGDSVVVGLSEGVAGMRVGGHRTLTVPPSLGYGTRGFAKSVPPRATLTYDVELLSIK